MISRIRGFIAPTPLRGALTLVPSGRPLPVALPVCNGCNCGMPLNKRTRSLDRRRGI